MNTENTKTQKHKNTENKKTRKQVLSVFFVFLVLLLVTPAPAAATSHEPQCCIQERSELGNTWSLDVDVDEPCRVKPENENCRSTVPARCFDVRTADGTVRRCTPGKRERGTPCSSEPAACKAALIQTISNCPNLSAADCDNPSNRAGCFLYNNRCYSRVDGNVCPRIIDPDNCAKSSRCRWQNNSCLSLLEAGLSGQYTKSGDSPLPECAFGGTCRDVNDLIRLVLRYASRLFSLLGVIGFVMFVYGGLMMVLSFGNPEKFKQGQMALVAAIIGIAIALSAYLLVNFILSSIGATAEFRAL